MAVFLFALLSIASGFRTGRKQIHKQNGGDCFSTFDGRTLLTYSPCTKEEVAMALEAVSERLCVLGSDEESMVLPEEGGCGKAVLICDADVAQKLEEAATVISSDAGAYYRRESGCTQSFNEFGTMNAMDDSFYSDWRNLDDREARIRAAVEASGGLAKLEVAGKSFQDRNVYSVRITGEGFVKGNPRMVLSANVHAREWIAGMAGLYALEKLIDIVVKDPDYVKGIEIVMIPMANPDGFFETTRLNRLHRKNMKPAVGGLCVGVDINRNCPIAWSQAGASGIPCMDNYYGSAALSEPETQILDKVFRDGNMTVYYDVHSYTQLILSSWGWTKEDHPRKDEIAALGGKIKTAIEGTHGKKYKLGPAAQVLYRASGTLSDYASEFGALAYTLELRPGFNLGPLGFMPPKGEILPCAEETWEGILQGIEHTRAELR